MGIHDGPETPITLGTMETLGACGKSLHVALGVMRAQLAGSVGPCFDCGRRLVPMVTADPTHRMVYDSAGHAHDARVCDECIAKRVAT